MKAILCAFLAALFYAVNIPLSKLLLDSVGPTTMAALLYLGAGLGVGIMALFKACGRENSVPLSRRDMPFVIGMIILDIAAPTLLMLGIQHGSPANASLLGNFEIVATAVVALFLFKEAVSFRLWTAIALITTASAILSFDGGESLQFSYGSLFVLLATVCWGFENNCTRRISSKSTYEIVILKGVFSGLGALAIAFAKREPMPNPAHICEAMILGFVAYGLSIFLYVRAQNTLGAAKTSAYYAIAPFAGALLSFVILGDGLSWMFLAALAIMAVGAVLVVFDILIKHHTHLHSHIFSHYHDGTFHEHTVVHSHVHNHCMSMENHTHKHQLAQLEESIKEEHAEPKIRHNGKTEVSSV